MLRLCRFRYVSRMPAVVQLLHVPQRCRVDMGLDASQRPATVTVMCEEGLRDASGNQQSTSMTAVPPVHARVWYGAGGGDLYLEALEPATWPGRSGKLQLGWRGRRDAAGGWILCQLVVPGVGSFYQPGCVITEEPMPQP